MPEIMQQNFKRLPRLPSCQHPSLRDIFVYTKTIHPRNGFERILVRCAFPVTGTSNKATCKRSFFSLVCHGATPSGTPHTHTHIGSSLLCKEHFLVVESAQFLLNQRSTLHRSSSYIALLPVYCHSRDSRSQNVQILQLHK